MSNTETSIQSMILNAVISPAVIVALATTIFNLIILGITIRFNFINQSKIENQKGDITREIEELKATLSIDKDIVVKDYDAIIKKRESSAISIIENYSKALYIFKNTYSQISDIIIKVNSSKQLFIDGKNAKAIAVINLSKDELIKTKDSIDAIFHSEIGLFLSSPEHLSIWFDDYENLTSIMERANKTLYHYEKISTQSITQSIKHIEELNSPNSEQVLESLSSISATLEDFVGQILPMKEKFLGELMLIRSRIRTNYKINTSKLDKSRELR